MRRLGALLPTGTPLPDEEWRRRQGILSWIAVLHAPLILAYALWSGEEFEHALADALPTAVLALIGLRSWGPRLARELPTTLALAASSAAFVHLSHGLIEAHFHFFIVVALVALLQQWAPFLLAIAFVLVHHGVAATIDPRAVYNHPAALAAPWAWAAVHATFISMASAVGLANWKLNEASRTRAERYFRQLYEGEQAVVARLEEADRVKSELVSAISHEFRTPLTGILGFSRTLVSHPELPSEQRDDMIVRIQRQSLRLQTLIENLLESERPLSPSAGLCDVKTVVEDCVELCDDASSEHHQVDVDVPQDLQLHLAASHLRLIATNLLSNAMKFSTPGAPVSIRCRTHGDGVLLSVANHGQPIPERYQKRIFEPFVQADSSMTREVDGVGLGLHLVRRVVTVNGGTISVTCFWGITTFEVWLPDHPPTADPGADTTDGLVSSRATT